MVYQSEAVVLQATVFKEYDRILTLFSTQGVFKLFVKGSKKNYFHLAALTTPLTLGEFYYTLGKKDLHRFQEGSILNQNRALREKYDLLQVAEKMRKAVLDSQWVGKSAPQLFHLFCLLLAHLPQAMRPYNIETLFYLKILVHEGLLQMASPIDSPICRYAGECFPCLQNAPQGALSFEIEEENWLQELAHSRSRAKLSALSIDEKFQKKIELLFQQAFL